jgi:hypothetical protein
MLRSDRLNSGFLIGNVIYTRVQPSGHRAERAGRKCRAMHIGNSIFGTELADKEGTPCAA